MAAPRKNTRTTTAAKAKAEAAANEEKDISSPDPAPGEEKPESLRQNPSENEEPTDGGDDEDPSSKENDDSVNEEEGSNSKEEDNSKEEKESSDSDVIRVEVVYPGAMVLNRVCRVGDVFELTPAQVDRTRDGDGNTWVDIIDDRDAQEEKYGKRLFKRA